MPNLNDTRRKFITIYVKFFRHYRTKQLVFPKPPNKYIKLKIPIDKWRAYQKRKARHSKVAA
jgi:hypothetical protein